MNTSSSPVSTHRFGRRQSRIPGSGAPAGALLLATAAALGGAMGVVPLALAIATAGVLVLAGIGSRHASAAGAALLPAPWRLPTAMARGADGDGDGRSRPSGSKGERSRTYRPPPTSWRVVRRDASESRPEAKSDGYERGLRDGARERSGATERKRRAGRRSGNRKDEHQDENIAVAVGKEMMEDDALNVAGGMAYFAFLALPPTILVIFALTGFFGGDQAANWITDQLTGAMPDEAGQWVDGFVDSVVRTNAPGPFSIGVLLALWAASNVFMAVARALNIAYDVEETRGFVRLRATALGVTILFTLFLLLGSASLILGPQIAQALDLYGLATGAWSVIQWVLPFVLVIGAIWLAYYVLPNRDQKRRNREILIGAAVGAMIWVLASVAFRFYISNFGNYDEVYGALGGIIILLLWLYLTMLVILLGGQIAAELERRRAAHD
jgi:membrane protein